MSNAQASKSPSLAAGRSAICETSMYNHGTTQDKNMVTHNDIEDENEEVDIDDTTSETSTICYEHEPFDTFQNKVAELVAKHFKRSTSEVHVQRMKGGSFNRVIGINILVKPNSSFWDCFKSLFWSLCTSFQSKSHGKESYIIRIPRRYCSLESDVAILRAVRSLLPLPIPEVVAYDISSDNFFESPYMIQKRLVGQNLKQIWMSMNIEQKKNIAKDIINLVPLIASVEATPGKLSSNYLSEDTFDTVCVDKFDPGRENDDEASEKPNPFRNVLQKPIELLLDQCERWRQEQNSDGVCFYKIWNAFVAISKSLESRGFLDGPCVLVHGDLKMYNLLAEVRNPARVEITGVIDWDSAVIAPEFMAYRAPFWLWTPEHMDSAIADDESNAIMEPQNDEDQALKTVFIEHASEKYRHFAFAPEATLARRMFKVLQNGIYGPWDMTETEDIICRWNDLHPEDDILHQGEDKYEDEDEDSYLDIWAVSLH